MPFDCAEFVASIRVWHRQRVFAMEQRKRVDLALGSFLRPQLGWRKGGDTKENATACARAATLIEMADAEHKGKPLDVDEPAYEDWRNILVAAMATRSPWDALEKQATKEMEKFARCLPVWDWAKDVRGLGARSLAIIVAEAGDLSAYPKKGHLWKRMGLAVMDGVRQGGLGKGASKDEWIVHAYNAKRRSQMFIIGDVMVKVGSHYRDVYLKRKEYERKRAEKLGLIVAPAAKIPKARAEMYIADGVIHRRSQRYMEKRLLKDLWQAWNYGWTGVVDEKPN